MGKNKKIKDTSLDVNNDGVVDAKDIALVTEAAKENSEEIIKETPSKKDIIKITDTLELPRTVVNRRRG
jgi:hypothetical protein